MQGMLHRAGLVERVEVDSAGTGDWHVGDAADLRTREAAQRRGMAITHRARQLVAADFQRFDWLLAMDRSHELFMAKMQAQVGGRAEVRLLRSFEVSGPPTAVPMPSQWGADNATDVPDPYYGDRTGFELVLDLCESACRGLLIHVQQRLAGLIHHRMD